ncbi:hypothetical protein FKM82_010626 [Ascaphus truei]
MVVSELRRDLHGLGERTDCLEEVADDLISAQNVTDHELVALKAQIHWKLCIFCLLCEAYTRWLQLPGSGNNPDPEDIIRYAKEWDFYRMFGIAALEQSAFFAGIFVALVGSKTQDFTVALQRCFASESTFAVKLWEAPSDTSCNWEHDYTPSCASGSSLFLS